MREAFVIAKREFLERVRTKWFVVITLLGPLLMVGLIVVPVLLEGAGIKGAKVAVVDHTGVVGQPLATKLADKQGWKVTIENPTTTEDVLKRRLREREINGYLDIPADALTSPAVVVTYKGDNASNTGVGVVLQRSVQQIVLEARARAAKVTEEQLAVLRSDILVVPLHTNGKSEAQSGMATFFLGYIIAMILYMVITLYGINVMRSVVTEKSSRVMELMVAATRPRSLMAGKILGVGGAGLAQITVWLTIGGIALAYREQLLSLVGIHGGSASSLPAMSIEQILVIVVFFVLGYIFYSTIFAALGATVSSEQDAQQAQIPITMLLVVGLVSMTAITGDPRGSTSQLLTLVPFWSPMLMPLRYLLGGATPGEVALSVGILVASALLITRAAAKIYRVGILMYGKRPSLAELIRWLRY